MIEINNTYELDFPDAVKNIMEKGIEAIFADAGKEYSGISLTLLTDEALLEINKEFLKHDYYTDIITFLYSEEEEPVEAELFISTERVQDNAKEIGETYEKELLRVIYHGCLHLCGYEDSTEQEKQAMRNKEDEYLARFAL